MTVRLDAIASCQQPFAVDSGTTAVRFYDDFALLMRRGDLYDLDGSALFLLREMVAAPMSPRQLTERLAEHYAIPFDVALPDVAAFLDRLIVHGLVTAPSTWVNGGELAREPIPSADASSPGVMCWQVARERRIPLKCKFDVTYRCNIACKFCYNGPRPGLPGPYALRDELSIEEIDGMFGQLRAAGTFLLSLSGGEPLARQDLGEILALTDKWDFAVEILTNGTLVTPKLASELAAHRIQLVVVPLFGADPLTHDRFVRMPGAFDRACAGIQALARCGIEVGVRCAITQENYEEWPALRTLVSSWGVRCFPHVQVHLSSDRRVDTRELRLTDAQLADLFDSGLELNPGYRCQVGLARVDVLPNGDVALCSLLTEPVGNLRHQTFADIWEGSPRLGALRHRLQNHAIACNGCHNDEEYRCGADALFDDGDLAQPSSEALRVIRMAKAPRAEAVHAHTPRS
jgi:MoaA/NifB/PqqE/SkfB family radical SAM enzyme